MTDESISIREFVRNYFVSPMKVSSNVVHGEVYSIQLNAIKFVNDS